MRSIFFQWNLVGFFACQNTKKKKTHAQENVSKYPILSLFLPVCSIYFTPYGVWPLVNLNSIVLFSRNFHIMCINMYASVPVHIACNRLRPLKTGKTISTTGIPLKYWKSWNRSRSFMRSLIVSLSGYQLPRDAQIVQWTI